MESIFYKPIFELFVSNNPISFLGCVSACNGTFNGTICCHISRSAIQGSFPAASGSIPAATSQCCKCEGRVVWYRGARWGRRRRRGGIRGNGWRRWRRGWRRVSATRTNEWICDMVSPISSLTWNRIYIWIWDNHLMMSLSSIHSFLPSIHWFFHPSFISINAFIHSYLQRDNFRYHFRVCNSI